ncbi:TPA: amino acid adenylation domain-containing protein, partial [Streptococcus pyogenes]|nr:amino acid adenylation domain-containing protein [Streptococcus pyogenes]
KPEMIEKVVFSRRKKIISKETWTKIKENAYKNKVTPSMVLLSAYSMIIERWTNQEKFVINVPLFNRDANYNSVKRMVADFTNLLLVECERKNENFLDRVKTISRTFLQNASHSSYSGVQVQRDVYKEVGKTINIAPVVFACNIDYPLETKETRKILGKINYMVSQTPQVWLDFQTYLVDDDIVLCWDVVDELYPDGMIDDMFESLYTLLQSLSDNENWYRLPEILPSNQIEDREKELKNILPLSYPKQTLYAEFLNRIKLNPDKAAIVDAQSGLQITYGNLYKKALTIASNLISFGVKKNDYVGITLPRGYSQIVGILGILFAGAAYVPIGINQPNERRRKIYEQIGIKYVLSNENTINDLNLDDADITFVDMNQPIIQSIIENPVDISCFDTAYVIMTSGTTGIPKGVEIAHNSAVNTINDLNERYEVNTNDGVIMVSAIDFDLSVYDIFGILSAGGTIISLDDNNFKDPELWLKLIGKYEVTMWDSVPILFDMLVTMAEGKNVSIPLRLVFLSGDWIATTLPKRFYNRSKNSLVVGMGGGTEASIWSNYINIPKEIPKNWISIPYGKALKNQVYRVVDGLGRICPNYVKGELLIGGVGVAKGYRGDKELTEKKFVESDGIKWYRTGDAGRTWNDGTIEFLGRLDNQVKVKGHRIELGEIEFIVKKIDSVIDCCAIVIEHANVKMITLYVVCTNPEIDSSYIKEILKNHLPNFMIPERYYFSKNREITINGKLERKKIKELIETEISNDKYGDSDGEALSDTEKYLAELWERKLNIAKIYAKDNYFELGGDSLVATSIINEINSRFGLEGKFSINMIFEYPTVRLLSNRIDSLLSDIEIYEI